MTAEHKLCITMMGAVLKAKAASTVRTAGQAVVKYEKKTSFFNPAQRYNVIPCLLLPHENSLHMVPNQKCSHGRVAAKIKLRLFCKYHTDRIRVQFKRPRDYQGQSLSQEWKWKHSNNRSMHHKHLYWEEPNRRCHRGSSLGPMDNFGILLVNMFKIHIHVRSWTHIIQLSVCLVDTPVVQNFSKIIFKTKLQLLYQLRVGN